MGIEGAEQLWKNSILDFRKRDYSLSVRGNPMDWIRDFKCDNERRNSLDGLRVDRYWGSICRNVFARFNQSISNYRE